MHTSAENKRLNILISLLIVTILVAIPMIAFGVPGGAPPWNLPDASFSSITLGSPTANGPAMTGSYGRFVGMTAALQGNVVGTGGYAKAKAACSDKFTDSHVCTAREIINSIEYGSAAPSAKAWINNGPPAYVSDISNDCNGWTSNNNNDNPAAFSTYGSIWNNVKGQSLMATCGRQLPFACCSY